MWRNTYLSECGKMWTRITPNTDTFYAVCVIRRSFSLLYLIVEGISVLILLSIEKLLSEIAYAAGTIRTILIKKITSESRERFSVDRFCVCKCKKTYPLMRKKIDN